MLNPKHLLGLRCIHCDKEIEIPKEMVYVCPTCGGNVQVAYNYGAISKVIKRRDWEMNPDRSIWRYEALLPVRDLTNAVPLQLGNTPLYRSQVLSREWGLPNLWIKDDSRNPSASFKDRAGAIALAHAMDRGEKLITGASTGNAASSLACLASVMKMKTLIFVPQTAPQAKIAQLLVFGAEVITVKGTYDQAFDLCLEASRERGWYNRNTGYNPYTREGKKTCSFEIVEQLEWDVPDWVVVPVGDGNIISGIWKGFTDLKALGWIDRMPRLLAVQSGESDAIVRALDAGGKIPVVSGNTVADSISVSIPRDGEAAVQAIQRSGGFGIQVSDEEVLTGIRELAQKEGVFPEPAAAASYAGLKKAIAGGRIPLGDSVVMLITGSGLKDIASAMKTVGKPHLCEANAQSLKAVLGSLK